MRAPALSLLASAAPVLAGCPALLEDFTIGPGPSDAAPADATEGGPRADGGADAAGDRFDADAGPDAPTLPDVREAEAASCPCVTDLSGVGLADFYVSFMVTTTSTTAMAIASQWRTCDATDSFWYVALKTGGTVGVNYGGGLDAGGFAAAASSLAVSDGSTHKVVAGRAGGMPFVEVDGVSAQGSGPAQDIHGQLPPIQVGTNQSCGPPDLVGQIAALCISTPCRAGQ